MVLKIKRIPKYTVSTISFEDPAVSETLTLRSLLEKFVRLLPVIAAVPTLATLAKAFAPLTTVCDKISGGTGQTDLG